MYKALRLYGLRRKNRRVQPAFIHSLRNFRQLLPNGQSLRAGAFALAAFFTGRRPRAFVDEIPAGFERALVAVHFIVVHQLEIARDIHAKCSCAVK